MHKTAFMEEVMKSVVLLLFTLPIISFAQKEGVSNGGGGKGIICRDSKNKITKAEVLDLYEARELYQLPLTDFKQNTVSEIIEKIKLKLKSSVYFPEINILKSFDHVLKIKKIVSDENIIKPIDDAAEVFIPKSCHLEQIANYVNEDLLIISEPIWNALSDTHKAGLLIHEVIYKIERDRSSATDSSRARKIVGHLFSDFKLVNVMENFPEIPEICFGFEDDKYTKQNLSFVRRNVNNGKNSEISILDINKQLIYSKLSNPFFFPYPWSQYFQNQYCMSSAEPCYTLGGDLYTNFENKNMSFIFGYVPSTYTVDETGTEHKTPEHYMLKINGENIKIKSYLKCSFKNF